MQVCGPTQSGKSFWVAQLLENAQQLMEEEPSKITWYSPHGHIPLFLQNVESKLGLPWDQQQQEEEADSEQQQQQQHRLIILDDFADLTKNSKELTALFTKHSHHTNTSIIQITQNLFWAGADARTRSLNVHYLVLMRQLRDQKQIRLLARQVTQREDQFRNFLDAYNDATASRAYSYLFVSFHPRDPTELLLRTNLFPSEASQVTVYLIKGGDVKTINSNYKFQ